MCSAPAEVCLGLPTVSIPAGSPSRVNYLIAFMPQRWAWPLCIEQK